MLGYVQMNVLFLATSILSWTGPFDLKAVIASTATLDLPEHWRLLSNTFHVYKLRPYQPRPGDLGPPDPPPPPALIQEGQSWYEVDLVVKHSWRGRRHPNGQRQLHYMVLFKGYSDAYNVCHCVAPGHALVSPGL